MARFGEWTRPWHRPLQPFPAAHMHVSAGVLARAGGATFLARWIAFPFLFRPLSKWAFEWLEYRGRCASQRNAILSMSPKVRSGFRTIRHA